MPSRVFIDTTVFVYLFDGDTPAKRARARELIASNDMTAVVSTQVLQEFYVTVTRKLAAPRDIASFEVVAPDVPMVLRATARSRSSSLSLWDALIVEAATEARCERRLLENLQAGQRSGRMQVKNPFAGVEDPSTR